MKIIFKILALTSVIYSQHVTLYLDQVIYSDSDNVDIYINMDSDAPIASFNFTLNGFGNVLSTNSISNLSLSYQYLESLSFVGGYFSGGDTNSDPIPIGGGPGMVNRPEVIEKAIISIDIYPILLSHRNY